MSRKFDIEVTFDLETSIEFDGSINLDDSETLEGVDVNMSYDSSDVSLSGGTVTFVVEADGPYEAESKAESVVSEGYEVQDSDGLTWVIANVSVSVEEIEEPMTLERAVQILTDLVDSHDGVDDEAREAFAFILAHLAKIESLKAQVELQAAKITALEQRQAAQVTA
jgi:hypothetical protein